MHGLGKLKDRQVTLYINETVTPVAQPRRRVTFHLRQKVEDETNKLEQDDIIEKVPENTPNRMGFPSSDRP